MENPCDCYVATLSPEDRFGLRYGAHALECPIYRVSGDPVDRAKDERIRARMTLYAIIKPAQWSWLCKSCGYGREYPTEWENAQSSEMHRHDNPGHATITHCGPLTEIHLEIFTQREEHDGGN